MTTRDAQSHSKEVLRRLGEKIRHELLSPNLNVRNLLAQIEQTAHLARVMIEEAEQNEPTAKGKHTRTNI